MAALKIIFIILAVLILLYLIFGFVFFFLALGSQRRDDYSTPRPGSLFERNWKNEVLQEGFNWFDNTPHEEMLIPSHEKGKQLHAQYFSNPDTNLWAIFIHGYSNFHRDVACYAMEYHKRGYNTLIPDLRGHGNSESKFSSMAWLDHYEIVDWINYIAKKYPDSQIVIHGVSMGGATTMMTTGEKLPKNVVCAVEDCGFRSVAQIFSDQSRDKYHIPPWLSIPAANIANLLINHFSFYKASAEEQVKKSVTPTFFLHGDKDDFVKFENLDYVYNACAAEKEKWVVKDAAHAVSNLWFHELYWQKVDAFLAKHVKKEDVKTEA